MSNSAFAYHVPDAIDLRECRGSWLFADGGVIHRNPSAVGGTWAWIRVEDGEEVASGSGVVTPCMIGLETVSNNISELFAVVKGIAALPPCWIGTICSDSHVTLCRRVPGSRYNGVPKQIEISARKHFARVTITCRFVLLDGHPNPAQLACGIGKRGNPCSAYNVKCDAICTELAGKYKEAGIVIG